MSDPPIIFGPRWWRLVFAILGEAELGGRLLCKVGLHRWAFRADVDDDVVTDYAWCRRPWCRYRDPMLVNREHLFHR